MPTYLEILLPRSEHWRKCARHRNSQSTEFLGHIYLCDPCAERLVKEAFNDRPPIYHGETIEGFCGLCSKLKAVTLRQWFVCPICWNVVVAYQKSFVASDAVLDYWEHQVRPQAPTFELDEKEPVRLAAFERGKKTKAQAAETLEVLDFLVSEIVQGRKHEPRFHIELKAGPSSIDEMSEFQLDVNDFNDIVGASLHTGLPAYIFHVQLEPEYRPPTRRTVAKGLWWTDEFTLAGAQKRVARRRGEDKDAIYFNPSAFRPIESFTEELEGRRFEELRQALVKGSIKPVR